MRQLWRRGARSGERLFLARCLKQARYDVRRTIVRDIPVWLA